MRKLTYTLQIWLTLSYSVFGMVYTKLQTKKPAYMPALNVFIFLYFEFKDKFKKLSE